MSSQEIVPSDEIIDAVLENTILPILKELEDDLGKRKYSYSIYVDDEEMSFRILDCSGQQMSNEAANRYGRDSGQPFIQTN